jgi:pheromone shutdown-related protein TraB
MESDSSSVFTKPDETVLGSSDHLATPVVADSIQLSSESSPASEHVAQGPSVLEDPNVCVMTVDGQEIILIGTAHVSQASAELVERAILELHPDVVAIELCASRYDALKDPERWKNTNIVNVIRQGKAHLLFAQLLLSGFQKRIANKIGVRPGEEMLRAIETAEKEGIRTVLADRDVTTTLKRTWSSLRWWSLIKILGSAFTGLFSSEEISAEEIERLKTSDALEEALSELSGALPEVRLTLIDERDRYLAKKIGDAKGPKVLAVIGAGHMTGVKGYLGSECDIQKLEVIPPPSQIGKWIELSFLVGLVVAFIYGFQKAGAAGGAKLVGSWALVTACAGAFGSLITLAHPLTILASFLAAPIAAVHPLIATGWVSGLVEAWLHQPKVADFETLLDDMGTVKGFWNNRVSRILLIVVSTNLCVGIGNLVGGAILLRLASVMH